MKLTNQQVGRAGELFAAAEIHRRGGYAVTFAGNMPGIDMLASDRDNTHRVSVQVRTKGPNSAGWQTSTRHGLSCESAGCARCVPGQDSREHVSAGQARTRQRTPEPLLLQLLKTEAPEANFLRRTAGTGDEDAGKRLMSLRPVCIPTRTARMHAPH